MKWFQFHKGTIRTFLGGVHRFGKFRNFNSIKVRLELLNDEDSEFPYCYFNSIKVRLERRHQCITYASVCQFQFHKGTIRTSRSSPHHREVQRFQFHKGTIRTNFLAIRFLTNIYFNSIKVRLEQNFEELERFRQIFQFHKGTIRTDVFTSPRIYTTISIP